MGYCKPGSRAVGAVTCVGKQSRFRCWGVNPELSRNVEATTNSITLLKTGVLGVGLSATLCSFEEEQTLKTSAFESLYYALDFLFMFYVGYCVRRDFLASVNLPGASKSDLKSKKFF